MTHIGSTNHDAISGNGPDGGMLIYYSPDAGGGAYISTNNKFNSETELQKYKNSQFLYIDEQPPYDLSDHHSYHHHNNHQQSHNHHTHYYKRPMPFQKALEISNKLEQQNKKQNSTKNNDTSSNNRQSQYEMNYEISV